MATMRSYEAAMRHLAGPLAALLISSGLGQVPAPSAKLQTSIAEPAPEQQGDIASWQFDFPLSVVDATAILVRTNKFDHGGMPYKRQGQAFNTLFDSADRLQRFRTIAREGREAGRLYAAAAFTLFDLPAAGQLIAELKKSPLKLASLRSDLRETRTVGELADFKALQQIASEFRRTRDLTNAQFANDKRPKRLATPPAAFTAPKVRTLPLNWSRIALALVVPTVIGTLIALLIWSRFDSTLGSLIGAGAIVFVMLLFFSSEYIEVVKFKTDCTDVIRCKMTLSEFSRYGMYGIIGFIEAAFVFTIGLRFEEQHRAR